MISIICPFTNEEILNNMLLKSVKRQDYDDYELILIDSKLKGFSSASETLNFGAKNASGDILLFAHQDVEMLKNNILSKINEYCGLFEFGMGCVAGVLQNGEIISSVKHGNNYEQVGKPLNEPTNVFTCDECIFFIKKSNFSGFTDYGRTWHFYAVDYALQCRLKGENVTAFPLEIYHLSPGWSRDDTYWTTLQLLTNKYRGIFDNIPTTIGNFRINRNTTIFIAYKRIKNFIKKIIRK